MTPQELVDLFASVPEVKALFYRLYHDSHGRPLHYSMEDLPGDWIEITHAQYQRNSSHVRVIDGKLVEIILVETHKIVPGDTGTCCDIRDVAVVVETEPCVKWSKRIYETS